jgi:hypothetical protein
MADETRDDPERDQRMAAALERATSMLPEWTMDSVRLMIMLWMTWLVSY